MNLKYRIGCGAKGKLEDALEWAVAKEYHYVEFGADLGPNHMFSWGDDRVEAIRGTCDSADIHLGLHSLSSVNVAEFSPIMSDAVDAYNRAYIDLAVKLKCEWVIVHSGFYQGGMIEQRMAAAVDHLKTASDYAERRDVLLLLENHGHEPDDAEMHYFTHNVEECRYYFDRLDSDHLGWTFNIGHANLVPDKVDGFLDAFGIDRLHQVRLADNMGDIEGDMRPGTGNVDFASLFDRLYEMGYERHFNLGFGSKEEEFESRAELVEKYGRD